MTSILNSSNHQIQIKLNKSMITQNPKIKAIIKSKNQAKGSLYVSGIEGAIDLLAIKKLQIGCIISCQKGYLLNHPSELVSQYKYLPIDLNKKQFLSQNFTQGSAFIKDKLMKTNVMVHCLTGNNKSLVLILAFLIKEHQMNLEQSLRSLQNIIQMKIEDKLLNALKIFQKQQYNNNSYLKLGKNQFNQIERQKTKRTNQMNSVTHIIENPQNQISFTSNKLKSQSLSKQEKIDYDFSHTEPKQFQLIYSSNHEKYIGVKRKLKNSKQVTEQKNARSKIDIPSQKQIKKQNNNNITKESIKEYRRSLSTNQVLNKQNNQFQLQVSNNRQLKTQLPIGKKMKSQISNFLEENLKTNQSKAQNHSAFQFQCLSPSRILYFSDTNKNLNSVIQSIQKEYEKQSKLTRIKYMQKMANLKQERDKVQNCEYNQSPYEKLKSQRYFSQYTDENEYKSSQKLKTKGKNVDSNQNSQKQRRIKNFF